MKLNEIFAGGVFYEYPQHQVEHLSKTLLVQGKELTKLEGNQFTLLQVDNWYVLKNNKDQIVGWVQLEPYDQNGITGHELKMIYLLPGFRGTKAFNVLLFGVKNFLHTSLIIDGPVSVSGQKQLHGLSKRHFPVYWINSQGQKLPYTGESLPLHHLTDRGEIDPNRLKILIEHTFTDQIIWQTELPGGGKHDCVWIWFDME